MRTKGSRNKYYKPNRASHIVYTRLGDNEWEYVKGVANKSGYLRDLVIEDIRKMKGV